MGDLQQDPSMEEILASIKRVIADDSPQEQGRLSAAAAPRLRRTKASPSSLGDHDDVLELDQPVPEDDGLMSEDAAAASRHSLAALAAARTRSEPVAGESGPLEAVVRDMLRPLLKEWLDENLPALVEEIVTREVSRITGRRA